MCVISYPLSHYLLVNVRESNFNDSVENNIINMKIGDEIESFEKSDGIKHIFDSMVKNSWIDSFHDRTSTELYQLLDSLAEKSLIESMMTFQKKIEYSFPLDHSVTFRFEDNGQSGVKMHYEVTHSDSIGPLFKLKCEFLFDKNCQLSHEKNFIFIEFFLQCHQKLIDILDERTVMQVFLDWLKNLFHLNGSAFESPQSDADMEKMIKVSCSKMIVHGHGLEWDDSDEPNYHKHSNIYSFYTLTAEDRKSLLTDKELMWELE
ncbi:TPA: hypothetical protein PXN76_000428 [Yersinia enterocolitica]|nr:hypothetical protein [Yersinia enterocolitica]HDL7502069.1 hypothetical protein [Yersinia enterocolitica]